MNVIELRKPQD